MIRRNLKKLFFPSAAKVAVLLCGVLSLTLLDKVFSEPVHLETLATEEEVQEISDSENLSHYYENVQNNTVAISFVNHDLHSDYVTPMDYYETTRGHSGSIGAGHLTVKGYGLERRGYYAPANSFDYTSYGVGSSVDLVFTYDPPTKSSKLNEYTIADSRATKVDGYSLPGPMDTGALIILKRRSGDTGWSVVKKLVGLKPNGTPITYTPTSDDIFYGTYFRFVSAFQYYYLYRTYDGPFGLDAKHYLFVDCLQRVNVFIGKSADNVAFKTDYTESKTFELAKQTHLASIEKDNKDNVVNLSETTLSNADITSFKLITNSIKASESSASIENSVPVFHYNGSENESLIKETKGRVTTGSLNLSFTINIKHANKNKTTTIVTPIVGKGLTFIEGYKEANPLTWDDVGVERDNDLALVATEYSKYDIFMAINVAPHTNGEKVYVTISYFIISVAPNIREKYTFLEGHESDLSAYVAATTLTDGSVCFSSFTMTRDNATLKVEYAFNSNAYTLISEVHKTFTTQGKYRFRITNAFDEVRYVTIYLLDVAEDNAKSAYFNHYGGFSGLLDEAKRVYAPNSKIPCYGRGTDFYIDASETKPGLYGRILRVHPDGTYTELQKFENLHNPLTGVLNTIGQYCFEVNVGDPSSAGDHICYTVNFSIVDETTYVPSVNYDLLSNSYFASSYMPNVYKVKYKSLGEGSFVYVYPGTESGYQEAWDFAIELESLSIVFNDDGTYNYPLESGQLYTSKLALFADLKENAKAKIEKDYLDLSTALASEDYGDITKVSLDHDVYVVENESIHKELTVHPVYINHYIFASLREYESQSVKMTHIASGQEYDIPYDVDVSTILDQTGRYLVKETNWCGTREYEVIFVLDDVNTAEFAINYRDGSTVKTKTINQENNENVSSSIFYFKNVVDALDEYDLITVTHQESGNKQCYTINELKGTAITHNGTFEVKITNRIGYSYTFVLTVTGASDEGEIFPHIDNTIGKEITL